ncbi:MAG: hemB [Chlamydiales bacterium]|jgi:porphobilinogen synthase|nr:hemB [Chlamydiales bacterium]
MDERQKSSSGELWPTPIRADYLSKRPRRNRKNAQMRALIQETRLHPSHFVAPLFVLEGEKRREAISSMPGVERLSIDNLLKEVEELMRLNVRAVDLFCVTPESKKDASGSEGYTSNNLLQQAIRALKKEFPELLVMADIALDPFTSHGHDGIIDSEGYVLNDITLSALAKMSLLAAEAGVDIVAPSDMMDGRVAFIREQLDQAGFTQVGILAYSAKFASAFYGPFRDALQSQLKVGDKQSYQLSPANSREALLEAFLDEAESADLLLVKPALPYLDILHQIKERTLLPVGAYQVSGEYAMIHAAAERGWIDREKALYESLLSIRRAGADFIFTYAAKEMAKMLLEKGL